MRGLRHPIATFVLAVLAIIGAGVGVLASSSPQLANPKTGRTTLTPAQVTALSKVALWMARTNGDTSPGSVKGVVATREQALPVVFPGEMVNGAAGRCYVLVILGSFTALASPTSAVASPKGTVLTVIVDSTSYQVEDLSLGNVVPDIASLGAVFALKT